MKKRLFIIYNVLIRCVDCCGSSSFSVFSQRVLNCCQVKSSTSKNTTRHPALFSVLLTSLKAQTRSFILGTQMKIFMKTSSVYHVWVTDQCLCVNEICFQQDRLSPHLHSSVMFILNSINTLKSAHRCDKNIGLNHFSQSQASWAESQQLLTSVWCEWSRGQDDRRRRCEHTHTHNISHTDTHTQTRLSRGVCVCVTYLLSPGRITTLRQFLSSARNTFPTLLSSFFIWRSSSGSCRSHDSWRHFISLLGETTKAFLFDWQLSLTSHSSLCSAVSGLVSVVTGCVCVHEVMWGGVRAWQTDNFLLPIWRVTPTAAWALSAHSNSTTHTHTDDSHYCI